MTLAYDQQTFAGAGTTTDATPLDIGGLQISIADKTVSVFELDVMALRQNTSNPLVYFTRRIYTVTRVAGASSITGNTTILEHGDSSMEAVLAALGASTNVKVTVTGLAGGTYEWRVSLKRTTYAST